MVNFEPIRKMLPSNVHDQILDVATKYFINTPKRLAHFLSQCHHESMGFKVTEENLNYSADGLLKTFPKYFNAATAKEYARDEMRIASRVYANRMGNGNEESYEGWFYRGRGYIQLTGKNNYTAFDATVPDNVVIYPELVSNKYPMMSAGWFWNERKINETCDSGTVRDVTLKVNGGLNGLDDRSKLFDRYYVALKSV